MMNSRVLGLWLLVVAVGCLCGGVSDAQDRRTVTPTDMLSRKEYKGADIPDAIALSGGKELPLLRSAESASMIVGWGNERDALLSMTTSSIVVAINVDAEKGVWALLAYEGPKQWRLDSVAAMAVPAGTSVSCAGYAATESVFVLSQSGTFLTSNLPGRADGAPTFSRPPAERKAPEGGCTYEYPKIPGSIRLPYWRSSIPVLPIARNRSQIAEWMGKHGFDVLQSVGPDHLVLTKNVGSGILVEAVLVYVRTAVAERGPQLWRLACVGAVSTYVYYPAGMYIDSDARALVLVGAYGDKIGMLKLGTFAIDGRQ